MSVDNISTVETNKLIRFEHSILVCTRLLSINLIQHLQHDLKFMVLIKNTSLNIFLFIKKFINKLTESIDH